MSEPMEFLSSSVLVTGAILISQGECFIQNELSMNVSILDSREGITTFTVAVSQYVKSNS